MLTVSEGRVNEAGLAQADDDWFAAWRDRELGRFTAAGITYLDYTGAAPYPASLVERDAGRLQRAILGNPHSANRASREATNDITRARAALLDFLGADPEEYHVIFTPNATGACRLLGESYPFGPGRSFLLTADNHNSVNGIREFARARGATVSTIPLDHDLRLTDAGPAIDGARQPGLFAMPAQSNFSGVRHPLDLVTRAQDRGFDVLLDTAAFLPSGDLDFEAVRPDFLVLSLYKIIGYPGGVGALVARREAMQRLRRPWFAGGTVDWVTTDPPRHRLRDAAEAFEDGTPAFLAIGAVPAALDAAVALDRPRLRRHLRRLTQRLLEGLNELRHANGAAMIEVHGPLDAEARGATVALSVRNAHGEVMPCWEIEAAADEAGLAFRSGCFCNPGCAERAFGFTPGRIEPCLEQLGDHFTIPAFAECLGSSQVGAVRLSLGPGSLAGDVDRAVAFLADLAPRG